MITATVLLGWMAIGAAASLAAMAWPSRRGAAGLIGNLVLGMGGAVIGGLVGGIALAVPLDRPVCLLFSAAGCLLALVGGHALWFLLGGSVAYAQARRTTATHRVPRPRSNPR